MYRRTCLHNFRLKAKKFQSEIYYINVLLKYKANYLLFVNISYKKDAAVKII